MEAFFLSQYCQCGHVATCNAKTSMALLDDREAVDDHGLSTLPQAVLEAALGFRDATIHMHAC